MYSKLKLSIILNLNKIAKSNNHFHVKYYPKFFFKNLQYSK